MSATREATVNKADNNDTIRVNIIMVIVLITVVTRRKNIGIHLLFFCEYIYNVYIFI